MWVSSAVTGYQCCDLIGVQPLSIQWVIQSGSGQPMVWARWASRVAARKRLSWGVHTL